MTDVALDRTAGASAPVVRYVLPIDTQPVLDEAGFLIPPSWDPLFDLSSQPESTSALVESDGGWVLLAPGGAGKSTVMLQLAAADPDGTMVDLDGLDKAEIRAELVAAASRKRVYIDSLDVIAQQEPAFFSVFRRVLRETRSTASWRLACRPTAWRADLDQALIDASGGAFRHLQLLPLTLAGAGALLAAKGIDQARFLEETGKSGVRGGNLSPQTLVAMAEGWRETGELPATQAEAIEFQIARMLDEHRSEHVGRLSAGRRRRLAARLAAFSVFGGIAGFFIDPTRSMAGRYMPVGPFAVAVGELPDAPEPETPDRVTVEEYAEVLGASLFVPAAHAAIRFTHQQYGEYLAADFLRQRLGSRLGSPGQLATILGVVDGMIPAALAGVSAWLCALAPDGCAALVATNAGALMASGIDLSPSIRAAIIEGTFTDAVNGDLEHYWGLDPRSLDHPEIEDQLILLLGRVSSPDHQVWWLSRIARATASIDTSEPLAAQFLPFVQDSHHAHGRRAAVAAVATIGTDGQKSILRSYLALPPNEDPDDEILAVVARGLYPQLLSIADLLHVLRPRRDRNLIGGYYMFLNDLPGLAPATDVPTMLDWAAQDRETDDQFDRAYGRFLESLVRRAWAAADEARVRAHLATLLVALDSRSRWDLGRRGLPWTEGSDVDRRRALAIEVAGKIDDWWQIVRLELLTHGDGDWLLEDLDGMDDKARMPLAECLPTVLSQPTLLQIDRVLALAPDHPAYQATRGWRDPVLIDSPEAARARRWHEGEQGSRERNRQTEKRALDALRSTLDEAATDLEKWWRAVAVLQHDVGSGDHFHHDLTKSPRWSLLEPNEQAAVWDLGLNYVVQHRPAPTGWIGQRTVRMDQVGPDWNGVHLLTTLTRHNPDVVRALPTEFWHRWALAIIATWVRTNSDEHLRADLVKLVDQEGRAAFVDAALSYADLQTDGTSLSQNPVLDELCEDLAPLWVERLVDGRYTDSVASALMRSLAQCAPVEAALACRHFALTGNGEASTVAWELLTQLDPSFVVDHLGLMTNETSLHATVPFIDLKQLDDERLQHLIKRLLDSMPIAKDPHFDQADYDTGFYRMRRARHAGLEEVARRGLVRQPHLLTDS